MCAFFCVVYSHDGLVTRDKSQIALNEITAFLLVVRRLAGLGGPFIPCDPQNTTTKTGFPRKILCARNAEIPKFQSSFPGRQPAVHLPPSSASPCSTSGARRRAWPRGVLGDVRERRATRVAALEPRAARAKSPRVRAGAANALPPSPLTARASVAMSITAPSSSERASSGKSHWPRPALVRYALDEPPARRAESMPLMLRGRGSGGGRQRLQDGAARARQRLDDILENSASFSALCAALRSRSRVERTRGELRDLRRRIEPHTAETTRSDGWLRRSSGVIGSVPAQRYHSRRAGIARRRSVDGASGPPTRPVAVEAGRRGRRALSSHHQARSCARGAHRKKRRQQEQVG